MLTSVYASDGSRPFCIIKRGLWNIYSDSDSDLVITLIPEFGPIAALVLAIAIVSIIAVSAKTGLRFMPKY
ncbi:MAG: PEFG-CTERM sorting domain-containing protein [Thaumarchaeota archaeon]|nr:PEFG-CTERM sorting domain-containing protein [Nitrososphaerota archaeon]